MKKQYRGKAVCSDAAPAYAISNRRTAISFANVGIELDRRSLDGGISVVGHDTADPPALGLRPKWR